MTLLLTCSHNIEPSHLHHVSTCFVLLNFLALKQRQQLPEKKLRGGVYAAAVIIIDSFHQNKLMTPGVAFSSSIIQTIHIS